VIEAISVECASWSARPRRGEVGMDPARARAPMNANRSQPQWMPREEVAESRPPSSQHIARAQAGEAPASRREAMTVIRSSAFRFVLDPHGKPIEVGSGRFAKVFLGEERRLESKTNFRRPVVIKVLQKGVHAIDRARFQLEMELLERVQGHPSIVELVASGDGFEANFLPAVLHETCETEFMILEKLDMSLEERLRGSRNHDAKEDLLACDAKDRLFRVLDYVIPIASAIEYAHVVRNVCHRDINPANVLVRLPDPNLWGSSLQVRLADFNAAHNRVRGSLFFQSPEQETNVLELLVNVESGSPEVEYFEDFYSEIAQSDTFSVFNGREQYPIIDADRARHRIVLARPYAEASEIQIRARVQKSVGRPADIYSLGAMLYYLISGAHSNPKTLYEAFHKFIEYERADESNTIEAYLRHEYGAIRALGGAKLQDGPLEMAPADPFFSYKHYLDGNGELIDPDVMRIVAKCMIRNKPDSYCQTHDLDTRGVSELVRDLGNLYAIHGAVRPTHLAHRVIAPKAIRAGAFRRAWQTLSALFDPKR
jgi:serine/threonine protein kinase